MAPTEQRTTDPRLAVVDERDLPTEGLDGIPAVDEHGIVIAQPDEYMPYGSGKRGIQLDDNFVNTFQFPRYEVKVKLLKTKPSLPVLRTTGPKNLLSGVCLRCCSHIFYSQLKWCVNKKSKVKRPMCSECFSRGIRSYIYLEFRLKLEAQDAWGKCMEVYVIQEHAEKFLSCSAENYVQSDQCRKKTVQFLSDCINSKSFVPLSLILVTTPIRPEYYVFM